MGGTSGKEGSGQGLGEDSTLLVYYSNQGVGKLSGPCAIIWNVDKPRLFTMSSKCWYNLSIQLMVGFIVQIPDLYQFWCTLSG